MTISSLLRIQNGYRYEEAREENTTIATATYADGQLHESLIELESVVGKLQLDRDARHDGVQQTPCQQETCQLQNTATATRVEDQLR